MTVAQVRKHAKEYKYLIFRTEQNKLIGINTKTIFMGKNNTWHPNAHTDFVGCYPCTFNEYITRKIGFL